jgi:hypothetical protein
MSDDLTIRHLAEKIYNDYRLSISDKVSELLRLDAIQYTNLGIDSTKTEKNKVKSDSKYIYKQIKKVDDEIGSQLLAAMD